MVKTHMAVFDGIRGLAFFLVILVHGFAICLNGAATYVQGTGKYGVWLFFVLSAFLLTRNYIEPDTGKVEYILGRIIRIVPLYYLACIVYKLTGVFDTQPDDWFSVLFIQYGPSHLWTVPVEFYFYAILFCLWFIPSRRFRDVLFACLAAASLGLIFVLKKDENSISPIWYLSSFYIGYLLARLWPKLPRIQFGSSWCVAILSLFLLLTPGALYMLLSIKPTAYLMNWYLPLSFLWGTFIFAATSSPTSRIYSLLASSPLRFLGKISFSGYLFHWLVMTKIQSFIGSGLSTVVVAIGTAIIIGVLVFCLVEAPLMHLRKVILAGLKHSAAL